MSKRKAASLLRSAAKLIEKGGLCKGTYTAPGGKFCSLGAIDSVFDGDFYSYGIAKKALGIMLGMPQNLGPYDDAFGPITKWNDAPSRTKEEVVSMFRRTARSLEHGMVV